MNEKLITPSYWLLFIVTPAIIFGIAIDLLGYSIWVLLAAIIILLIIGEFGLKKWASLWLPKDSEHL
ncbi:hypothetical protein [Paraglaciecola arctica]|jgi:hypothetical protein|uniref:hypothetical protein n=1 Tax=Paraglaciecola arctica TaxID=1128911 RepID=UPI001C07BF0E|nr:hypothetical protein [Paraglaciecola arctica]MBU3005383.1 hypothetical protein [Paraglaciecola arctica]